MAVPLDHWGTRERIWAYGYGDMLMQLPPQGVGVLMPPTRSKREVPAWAAALKARRFELGKSQETVALDSGILNQTTVSELEGGKYELQNLTVARVTGLARGLEWSLAELEEETGIDLGLSQYVPRSSREETSGTRRRSVKRSAPLPPGLEAAIKIYGKRFEDLQDPVWQQYLAGFNWRSGQPQDPEAWLDLYRDLVRAGVEPGEA